MMKQKNCLQKKFQEEMTAKELLKADIYDQQFSIRVLRLTAGLQKKHRRQQRIYYCRDQGTKKYSL